MQINLSYDSSVGSAPTGFTQAMAVAVSYLDHLIASPITVSIEVGYGEITQGGSTTTVSSGALGGTNDDALWSLSTFAQTYHSSISSADQRAAYNEWVNSTTFANDQIDVSTAQQKAFGVLGASSGFDGSVGFQTNGAGGITYNFNPFQRAVSNEWDFIGVALHELTHALGRTSDVGMGTTATPLDMVRFMAAGQWQTGATGSPAYFSLDGGATALGNFDTTGSDPSDWASGANDANNAYGYVGVANDFGQLDLRELNVLGFARRAQTDDFEGKGTSDLIWRNSSSGALWEWQFMNGALTHAVNFATQSSYQIAGAGDFNGDGTSDLLLTNPTTGDTWTWLMSNGQFSQAHQLGDLSGWKATVGYFSGGGGSDILWENTTTDAVCVWKMQNGQPVSTTNLGVQTGWNVIGAGDFNGDGTSDVLLENGAGQVWDWMMANDTYVGAHNLGNVSGWSLLGSGDFTGSGTTDLLWRNNASNSVVEWEMSNGLVSSAVNLGVVTGFNVVATGDYYGTGTSDIVWQNPTSGQTIMWAMQNGQRAATYDVNLGSTAGFTGV